MAAFVAELRARGEPVTILDLEPPSPADGQNGADKVGHAYDWLERRLGRIDQDLADKHGEHSWSWEALYVGPWSDELDAPWHEHATPEQVEELRGFLDSLGPFFEGLAAATGKREIVWPLPEDSLTTSFWGPIARKGWRDVRGLLEARAIVAADPEQRVRSIEWLLALARRARVRTAMDHMTCASARRRDCVALRDGVEAGRLDPIVLRSRVDGLLNRGSSTQIPRALCSLRLDFIAFFPSLRDGSLVADGRRARRVIDETFNQRPPPSEWERVDIAVDDALEGLRFDGRAYVAALRGFDSVIPEEASWTASDEAALTAFQQSGAAPFLGGGLAMIRTLRCADAAEALARVALAACEHRATHGEWPRSCADLAPLFPDGVPVDPHTETPFALALEGAVLVLSASPAEESQFPQPVRRSLGLEWRLPGRRGR
jgi:hypothetical protein